MVSSGRGADIDGLALDIIEELDPVCIGKEKWVKTNDVGEGDNVMDIVVEFPVAAVLFVVATVDVMEVVLDEVNMVAIGVGMTPSPCCWACVEWNMIKRRDSCAR
ncbi:uncharacterized protein ATC70_007941 [Mucor velutinosus]|uniref:Uncharacterized protein n=1 Tax=Mucor velutinosus TaxID=708070 RepID=A0AAN7HVT1_9FUNG|nr:hypothetical protein ATC70_007941 [Mucor velutinosus]